MTKTISLLGSTGSIGRQTLEVVRELGLQVAALTASTQVDLMEQQIREFHPALAVMYDRDAAKVLRERVADLDTEVAEGPEGLLQAAKLPQADTVVTAVVGSVGLEPTLAAIRAKKRIALANKETLVWNSYLCFGFSKCYYCSLKEPCCRCVSLFKRGRLQLV